jgi:hypothetical protein
MTKTQESVLERLIEKAVRLGGDALDVDYKAGYEEACVMRGAVGWGIVRLPSSSPEGTALRKELYGLVRKRRQVVIGGDTYVLRGTQRDSFGETAFRVDIQLARPARR